MAAQAHSSESMECSGESSSVKSTPEVAKKNGQPVKRKSVGVAAVEQPLFEDKRLPEGWTRSLIQRQGGATAGKYDVYVISPQQKRFRSRNELRAFFEKGSLPLEADDFDFSVCGKDLKTPSGNLKDHKTSSAKDRAKITNFSDAVMVTYGCRPDYVNTPQRAGERAKSNSSFPRVRRTIQKKKEHRIRRDDNVQKMIELLNEGPASPDSDYSGFNLSPYFPWSVVKETKQMLKAKLTTKKWIPPRSPYNLLQENVYHNPWQLLIATILLNRTSGKKVAPIFYKFLEMFPSPDMVGPNNVREIAALVRPLGLHEKRAHIIVRFSDEYRRLDWVYPNELHGIGKYGNDSYRMFCLNEWRNVDPCDAQLIAYRNWLINNWQEFCANPELAYCVNSR